MKNTINKLLYLGSFVGMVCLWLPNLQAQISIGPAAAPVLRFPQVLGNKILLAGNGAVAHTGIGVQSTVLQMYVPPDGTSAFIFNNITRGYFNDFGFNELMRVSNKGNVGINKADPAFRLDINGSMRIRSTPGSTAGALLGTSSMVGNAFFLGMQNDESFGFYYVDTKNPSWKFTVSAPYGHLAINGSAGADGAMLSSNGGLQPAAWQVRNYQNFYKLTTEAAETKSYSITDGAPIANPPGLSVTQNYTEATKIEAIFNVQALGTNCAFCGFTDFIVRVMLDGSPVRSFRYTIENGYTNTHSGSTLMAVAPGSHTVSVQIQKISGPTLELSNTGDRWSNLNLVCTPAN